MKVALVTPQFPNTSHSGGAIYARELAKKLDKKTNLSVFLPNRKIKKLDEKLDYVFVDMPKTSYPFLERILFSINVRRKLEEEDFDIVHVNNIGGLFLDRIDMLTIHHVFKSKLKQLKTITTYFGASKSRYIVAVSRQTKEGINRVGWAPNNKIKVIPNGINPVFLKKPNEEKLKSLKEKYGFENKMVGFHVNSTFHKRKNFELILETARFISNNNDKFRLLVLGKKKYKEYAINKLEEYGIEDITTLVTNLSDNEVKRHYHISDFLMVSSLKEGFCFPLIEALAVGIPFVSFDVGIAEELHKDGYGYVAEDEKEFKDICLNLSTSPIKYYESSRKYIKENYTWEKVSNRMVDFYQKIK